jgi:hypothetical protein
MVKIKYKKKLMAEKAKAQKHAKKLRSLMHVTTEEWVKDVEETRQEH